MSKFIKVAVLLAVFAVLFCIFSCESEEEKAKAALLMEKHIPIPKECDSLFPKIDINNNFPKDSAAFMECYNKYNGNKEIKCEESEFNEYSVCAVIHPKIFGFPRECLNFVGQKDSLAYYACCKRNNSCWMFTYDYEKSESIPGQMEYKWVNLDNMYSIEDAKDDPELPIRKMRENRKALIAKMDSICNEEKNAHICKGIEEYRNKLEQN